MNFNEKIILENDRVRLEPLTIHHFDELLPISIESPNLLEFSPSLFGSSKMLKENLEIAVQARNSNLRYPFAIFDKQQNRFVGSTSFGNISTKDSRLEIGWTWIDEKTQGTGLNKQCKLLLLSYAFGKLSAQRIEFKTDSRNIQSKKAIEKIGGTYEGTFRSHTLMRDGYRRDTAYYSILSNEWPEIKSEIFKENGTQQGVKMN